MNEQPRKQPPKQPRKLRITRVYTRTGDKGTCLLVGGQRVPKNHPRLQACGAVDELQVAMGAARDALSQTLAADPDRPLALLGPINDLLIYLQNMLFTLNSDLATRLEDRWPEMPLLGAADVEYMEKLIDALNAPLPPLADFVLPGGHPLPTAFHVCRVICRRAEREVETLAAAEPIGEWSRPVLNRFSDLFFVLARRAHHELVQAGLTPAESIWRRDLPPPPLP
jgi:cob(I)alamin adenosyltransferase